MRKFASRQSSKQASKQAKNISKAEATLILCGYSGERANFLKEGGAKNGENLDNRETDSKAEIEDDGDSKFCDSGGGVSVILD